MNQVIGEFIEQDATFWTPTSNTTWYYVYVDVANDNEEILLADYNSMTGELTWSEDKLAREILFNIICQYVERKHYFFVDSGSRDVDVLIYDIPEDEIKSDERE